MATTGQRRDEATESDTIIEIRNAEVTFEMDRGVSRVLNGVDLDVKRQEIVGVVGESGSGKSMLASAMLDAVDEPGRLTGEVTYYPPDGDPVDVLNLSGAELKRLRWEEIAMVFQGAMSSFNPTMTIASHFEETLKAHDADVGAGMDRARRLLSDLYLDPERVLESYPHELSGGMSQRALIALSLILEPNVLVMDEPTAALDLLMQRSILSLLSELQEKYDLTVIFITHDLPLVAGLADRLAVMYAFELVEVGPADELVRNATHPYTRALLKAVPNLDAPLETMDSIAGSAPDPVNIPSGCTYADRCPLADDQCRSVDPPMYDADDDGHVVACHHWTEASEAVDYDLGSLDDEIDAAERTGTTATTGPPEAAGPTPDRLDDRDAVVSLDDVEVHFEKEQGFVEGLFNDPETVGAVDGISLAVPERDVVALVGESGCGKTTLGKTAIGVQRPTGGSVRYRDRDVWEVRDGGGDIPFGEIRKSLQIIHQDPGSALNPNRTVMKTLAAPLKQWQPDLGSEDRQARILRMLERVGMKPATDYAHRFPHQLSGGEQQRVALVRALLMNPDLILADEAVSALDVSLRVEMMDLLLELQEEFGTSYLFISHNLSNARYLAETAGGRVGIMYLGELVEVGPAEEVLRNPRHPYTRVLRWATADLDPDDDVDEPPVRDIDIPDPVDPPSGCRFHTRCPNVIPPDGMEIDQAVYNEIMSLRHALDERSAELFGESPTGSTVDDLRERAFDEALPEPHRERVDEALAAVVEGDWERASAGLREHYESVCERARPAAAAGGHPVACHLYDPDRSGEPRGFAD
ncbi:dipeptide ABC transporter ATP-binding protein [Halomarina halobia]|uniref:Dipeptide ABC transporter ATP-binding protein n=1 Tax=Halomarina halobia TaxID=3033386 RepID=A0ABD6AFI6_9EURY|nr:ABC transporter ATP-binding protein [Halomarina sp. PSR21]